MAWIDFVSTAPWSVFVCVVYGTVMPLWHESVRGRDNFIVEANSSDGVEKMEPKLHARW